ncbi:hypothetical protein NEDG_00615 [Nematocida displodere]|uniref:Uncharacterized protein n=1 Tax=Nematocida displodere TaxID=1805483 RepID=A0A177EEB0_9MICR|nr:hypothetical protein NEDG_00615 [Nematocida displodere]
MEGLNSSYIVVESSETPPEAVTGPEKRPAEQTRPETPRKRRHAPETSRFVTILAPKKGESSVFLTPVKRTRRAVINGVKTGAVRLFDNSMEVKGGGSYLSLVECFKKLEQTKTRERRDSIDVLVRKYLG